MISVSTPSVTATIQALKLTKTRQKAAGDLVLQAMTVALKEAVTRNVSLTDHSLQELADLGHPYARRHGGIRIHNGSTPWTVDGSSRVHAHTGRLLRSLFNAPSPLGGGAWSVGFDDQRAPYAEDVVLGTQVMLPRDPIMDTAYAPGTKKQMMRAAVRVLGKELRTQGSVRFVNF